MGVDVFFVISGFLITSHLHREMLSRGTVSLPAFYARRARRLLPASLLVLLVTAVASWWLLPVTRWATSARELLASALYGQNWLLAARAVDYSALDDAASPVQHYWSLSVEEQFYLGWPALLLALVLIARLLRLGDPHRLLLPGVLVVTAGSLAWSVHATEHAAAAAYFVTPTRIWELGVGAVLALALPRVRPGRPGVVGSWALVVLRWAGAAVVLAAAVLLSSASPFPGHLALLPVLGTAAVIAAGEAGSRDPLGRLVDARPVQFLGRTSYSLYLWHWPVLVLAPFALGHPLRAPELGALVALSTGLAWLTRRWVEEPALRWRRLTRPALTAVVTVVAMAVVAAVPLLQLRELGQREDAARAKLASVVSQPCFGASARAPGATCADVFGPAVDVALTPDDQPWFTDPACRPDDNALRTVTCRFGDAPPTRRVVLVGDSHAEHWRASLHEIAAVQGWEVVEVLHGGCPAIDVDVLTFDGAALDTAECRSWGQQVDRMLAADPPDYVFTSSWASSYTVAPDGGDGFETAVRAYTAQWTAWADLGAEVFVLRDVPAPGSRHTPECVASNPGAPEVCASPRERAFPPDPAATAGERLDSPHVRQLDLSRFFCDDAVCHAVVGGALVYWDANHMSAQFGRTLAPYLLDLVLAND